MICFPNCKVNLGLNILEIRPDGFHNIESFVYPIPFYDVFEFLPAKEFSLNIHGFHVPGDQENLITKAWKILHRDFSAPPVHINLYKAIPAGAGLGGGSSDAIHFIKAINLKFSLGLEKKTLDALADELGSDCRFFIKNKPAIMKGRGDILEQFNLSLQGKRFVLANPGIHISTQEAYEMVEPKNPPIPLETILAKPIKEWRDNLSNDFEEILSAKYHAIRNLKSLLYGNGAIYASLTGSGSVVFGIFDTRNSLTHSLNKFILWDGLLEY